MKMKKVLALVLAFVLTITATIGGTTAYLTKKLDPKQNVFTVGDIEIDLTEDVAVIGEGGTVTEKEEGKGADYTEVMPGDYLKKEVTVSNTGKKDAYVAVTVTLKNDNHDFASQMNQAIDVKYGDDKAQAVYDFMFDGWGLNHGKDLDGDGTNEAGMRLTITGEDMPEHVLQVDSVKTIDEYINAYTGNWFGEQSDVIPFDGYYTTGMGKYELKYTYYMLLPAGEDTTLFNGLNIPADFTADQMKMFDGLKIDIEAKAIQADNMGVIADYAGDLDGEAKTAFAILADPTKAAECVATSVDTADELVENLEAGNDVSLTKNITINPANMSNAYGKTGINVKNGQAINGNGNTLDIKGAGGTWDSGINTTGGIIKNITITGSFRGVFINHNSDYSERVILDNVTIDGTTYTISCDQGMNQGLTATKSTFNGWTSYAATIGDVKFVDCNFGKGNGYAFCRPYAPTEFVGCDFEAGYQLDARAAVTFENCTIGGVALTADNLATLVTSNIANATIK